MIMIGLMNCFNDCDYHYEDDNDDYDYLLMIDDAMII